MKKEDFLNKLRQNTHFQYDMPKEEIKGIEYEDTFGQFVRMTETVGGNVINDVRKDADLNELVRRAYPDARVFCSNLKGITLEGLKDGKADYNDSPALELRNPDTVAEANDLNGTDVAIVEGTVGVAENGCIWIPQTMKEKALLFISEYLVIVLDRKNIVNNMHEAYDRIGMDDRYNFGTFISGPSKTADIEQALVMGAQAARGVTVVLVDE